MADPKKKPMPKPKIKYPRAKVGNYRAPVDTTGMDEETKKTFGFNTPSKTAYRKRNKA